MKTGNVVGFAALVFVSTVLLLCTQRAIDPYNSDLKDELQWKGSIAGTVLSDDSLPIAGVAVTVDSAGFSTVTDSLGRYRIPNVSAGIYRLSFTHAHYIDTTLNRTIELAQDQDIININMIIRRNPAAFPGSISGFIHASDSTKIKNVTATIIGPGNTTTSDSLGAFTLSSVVPGTYAVSFSHTHYYDTSITLVSVGFNQVISGIQVIMRKNPLFFTGSIAGNVVDSATHAVANGVVIAATPSGYITTSDVNGHYQFNNLPFGTYSVTASLNHRSNTRSGIVVFENDTTTADTLFAMRQDVLPRDISGGLTGSTAQVNKIITTIRGDLIDSLNPVVRQLTWLPISKRYTGNVYIPEQGILFNAEVRIYNAANRVIGYQRMDFDRGAATVSMPDFNAENALPIARAGVDTLVSINDTIWLHGSAVDTFDVNGRRINPLLPSLQLREWAIGNTDLFVPASFDTFIIAPSTPNSAFTCVLRVTDNDGNFATDTIKTAVILDAPVVNAGPDTIVTIGDTIRLHGTVTNVFGSIVSNSWDIGATGVFRASRYDTTITLPTSANNSYKCVLRVTDNDGNIVLDTMVVNVVLDAPVVNAGRDTAVAMGSLFTLHGIATQQFGSFTKYEWAVDTGAFRTTALTDTTITIPAVFNSKYPCRFRVTDNDGNVVVDTITLTAGCTWVAAGTAGFSIGAAQSIELRSFSGSSSYSPFPFYVSYVTLSGGSYVPKVNKWSGSNWDDYSTLAPAGHAAFRSSMTMIQGIAAGGGSTYYYETTYVGYVNTAALTGDTGQVRSGSSWTKTGQSMYVQSGYNAWDVSMASTLYGNPYFSYIDYFGNLVVHRYSGSWSRAGDTVSKGESAKHLSLGIANTGATQYVSYVTGYTTANHTVYVKRLSGTTWSTVGIFTSGDNWTSGLLFDNDKAPICVNGDTVFIAFVDAANSNHLSVYKYNGTTWSIVGTRGFTEGAVKDLSITVDRNRVFVAYLERDMLDRVSVKMFDGSAWITVGSRGFSNNNASCPSVAISQGVPFIAFSDGGLSGKLNVLKLQ